MDGGFQRVFHAADVLYLFLDHHEFLLLLG